MAELVGSNRGDVAAYLDIGRDLWQAIADTFVRWRKRVPRKQLVVVTSQLALMLETGNTISESLTVLSHQTEGTRMGEVLKHVAAGVESGRTLSDSMSEHPEAFPKLFVSAVRAGEASGHLLEVFRRLEEHMIKRVRLRENIRSALTYPAILTVLLLGVVIFSVTFVLPRFSKIFLRSGVVLPLPTRLLMAASTAAREYWYLIPVVLVAAAVGAFALYRSARFIAFLDRMMLRTPVLGELLKSVNTSSIARTLGMLLGAGVPLMESMEVAKTSVKSPSFSRFLDDVERSVIQGDGFSAPFRDSEIMTPIDRQMVQTGEKTGSLPKVMTRLADHHDEQIDIKLKRLTALVEPAFIALMGVFVGFVALAVLLPLFKMASAVKAGA